MKKEICHLVPEDELEDFAWSYDLTRTVCYCFPTGRVITRQERIETNFYELEDVEETL